MLRKSAFVKGNAEKACWKATRTFYGRARGLPKRQCGQLSPVPYLADVVAGSREPAIDSRRTDAMLQPKVRSHFPFYDFSLCFLLKIALYLHFIFLFNCFLFFVFPLLHINLIFDSVFHFLLFFLLTPRQINLLFHCHFACPSNSGATNITPRHWGLCLFEGWRPCDLNLTAESSQCRGREGKATYRIAWRRVSPRYHVSTVRVR